MSQSSKKKKKYEQIDLEEAVNKVNKGELTQYKACKMYNIPKQTLSAWVTGKSKFKQGRPTRLTGEEEKNHCRNLWILFRLEFWPWEKASSIYNIRSLTRKEKNWLVPKWDTWQILVEEFLKEILPYQCESLKACNLSCKRYLTKCC